MEQESSKVYEVLRFSVISERKAMQNCEVAPEGVRGTPRGATPQ